MSGTLTPLGVKTIGAMVPALVTAQGAISAAAAPSMGEIQGKLAGLLSVQTALLVPPVPTLTIAGAASAFASLQATFSVPQPTSPQLASAISVVAQLQAQLAAVQAHLTFAAKLGELAATGGVAAYAYSGTVDGLGDAISSELGSGAGPGMPPNSVSNALVLVTSSSATWTAMRAVFSI